MGMNSGLFATNVEMFFTNITAQNFLADPIGLSSSGGIEDLTDEVTYMKYERSYQRIEQYKEDPDDDKIQVMSFNIRSSLYQIKEKYTRYSVTNLMEDIGGLSSSVLVVFGFVFTACLCFMDQIEARICHHKALPPEAEDTAPVAADTSVAAEILVA